MNGIYQKTPSMYTQLRLILLHYCMTVYICIYLYVSYCDLLPLTTKNGKCCLGGREAFSERPDFFKAMDLFNSCREKDSNQTFLSAI